MREDLGNINVSVCVCVFFTLNRSSTRRHPAHAVSVLILHPRKISSVVTSHDTEIMHRSVKLPGADKNNQYKRIEAACGAMQVDAIVPGRHIPALWRVRYYLYFVPSLRVQVFGSCSDYLILVLPYFILFYFIMFLFRA